MNNDLELYIHIPFCVKKCNYCDFLSFPATSRVQEEYVAQLNNELTIKSRQAKGYTVSSVFVGGGTPSAISEKLIAGIFDTIYHNYNVSTHPEITIECNPGSALRHKFAAYRSAGINRLSIGLQSANNAELKMLGRIHTFEEFLKTYQLARMEGFDNINIDLMSCIPMQSLRNWKKTLKNVLMLRPEHISVYNLIIEDGTPFYDMYKASLLMMPSEDEQAAIDAHTLEAMAAHGYKRYEFSNYSRPGRESRHNIGYWTGVPYLGLGLGASSFFENTRWSNTRDMNLYLTSDFWDPRIHIEENVQKLDTKSLMEEYVYLGMRMIDGISADGFKIKFGIAIEDVFAEPLKKNMALGLIINEGSRYRLSDRGIDVSNVVLSDFLL